MTYICYLVQERWTATWGDEDIPCIALSTLSASVMHKLRWAKSFICSYRLLHLWFPFPPFQMLICGYYMFLDKTEQTAACMGSYLHCGSCSWPPLGVEPAAWAQRIWVGKASWGSGVLVGYLAGCSHCQAGSSGPINHSKTET